MIRATPILDGAQLFVRYAYPPNARGSCGPPDSDALLHYGQAGVTDAGLRELAKGFAGAWPYLELISTATGIRDPLDYRVVEAYWVGSPLLERVGITNIGNSMENRFRARTGHQFSHLMEGVLAGGVPNHSFHVFEVYPWLGLLRDDRRSGTALTVLDGCRIRWGEIVEIIGDEAVVRTRHLAWDGISLTLSGSTVETARHAVAGTGFVADLAVGDTVSLHWDWICDRLTRGQVTQLHGYTQRHLRIANSGVEHRGTAVALDDTL
ncbi:hypothetical protein E3T55_02850 [Cryobacterium frigoriphilum]|uniref:Uncharacterized protein n=1 Tax=Cryobacterium frigoriphilum TaxID=1259150 RepID=A0A4R9A9T7_9MICO|nr:DUF6390 family protein [Cryobacterium frigoriphilum]TFD54741.1 hypothetical protein E3T55_02850 [Cryobacterium frigoriphilum]